MSGESTLICVKTLSYLNGVNGQVNTQAHNVARKGTSASAFTAVPNRPDAQIRRFLT